MKRILNKVKITLQLNAKPLFNFSINKVHKNVEQALEGIKSGSTLLFGGFGLCGIPENSIRALSQMSNLNNITVVANIPGTTTHGLGLLFQAKKISKMIASYVGENKFFEKQYFNGEIIVELIPQGTLAEKLRAGGAGIPAFFTRTGVDTMVETGGFPIKYKRNSNFEVEQLSQPKETKVFHDKKFLLEESITGDYSLVKAIKSDTLGNLVFNKSARNFNPDVAMAGRVCIAEVEEIVEAGQIPPDSVHLPGIFVHRVFKGEKFEHYIEKLTIQEEQGQQQKNTQKEEKERILREKIARRACKVLKRGMYVNLGIGIPTLVPAFCPADITFQCENGLLGLGQYPTKQNVDSDLINASKETVTLKHGASTFSSSLSFGIIRGGHLDISIIGAMQVTPTGDIANWIVPHKIVKGMGGAMDLVTSGSKVVVAMQHCSKGGAHKIIDKCTYPLTGAGVVNQIITERAVFDITSDGLLLTDIAEGFTLEDIRQATGSKFKVAHQLVSFE